jgi:hypothetical protein
MWPAIIFIATLTASQHHAIGSYADARIADYRYFRHAPEGCETWEDRHKPACEAYAANRPGRGR